MTNTSFKRNRNVLLSGIFETKDQAVVQKFGVITEFLNENRSVIFLGKKEEYNYDRLVEVLSKVITSANRDYQIDVASFSLNELNETTVASVFLDLSTYNSSKLWNKKSNPSNVKQFDLLLSKEIDKTQYKKASVIANAVNFARNLQIMPPNELNSENLADLIVKETKSLLSKNFNVKVLNKKQIEELKMGLLLSVNRGSTFEPRVVVLEYTGNPKSKDRTVYVGKGITFDSGGYNIKTGRNMLGMKFDMSGSAIVASSLMAIAQLKPESNVSAVMMITDNRVNGDASLPDSVWTSMNGKSVEINNTDAEGRLVLADGITYAIRNLKATRVIDVATLTGAMLVALGTTYTGIWSTTDQAWEDLNNAAKRSHELVWRMPFNKAFAKNITKSEVADLKNTDLSGLGGSCSAAMFLKEFSEDVEFIHIDVAGTAEQNGVPTGSLVKTLTELTL